MAETTVFRSILPHEPLPDGCLGYLHVQGSFEPKVSLPKEKDDEKKPGVGFQWGAEQLLAALKHSRCLDSVSNLEKIELLDKDPPITKIRLTYSNPKAAMAVMLHFRQRKLSPRALLSDVVHVSGLPKGVTVQFSSRQLQITPITTKPLPTTDACWSRSNPPKFRRLLHQDGVPLEEERRKARLVYMTNLLDSATSERPSELWCEPHATMQSIRDHVNVYDTSGWGAEVFVSKKGTIHHCHVGMRSPEDAQALISGLQGKVVTWQLRSYLDDSVTAQVTSGRLFLDYAGITHRSQARAKRTEGVEVERGEPSRSECTSSTHDVTVPGLVLVPEYVTPQQEKVLMAVLTGPHAPWSPSQNNFSGTGTVKRRVQHYGYVFDYETANVLRDRCAQGSDCPPMPQVPQEELNTLDSYMTQAADQGKGWELLAGLIEKTRRHDFQGSGAHSPEAAEGELAYGSLNQMTVNEYKPGDGIGAHVDTPSAFSDGLISISLNSGIVMEFRKVQDEGSKEILKKLVYLPPRSLLLMSGAARYGWKHYIVTRMTDTHNGKVLTRGLRVSLTLRTAIHLPKDGAEPLAIVQSMRYPPRWGSDDQTKRGFATPATEKEHVHAVYDAIATQWHHTRGRRGVLWPGATQFLTQLPRGSVVADVGCGDGKYFPAIWEAGSYVIGSDISLPLLKTSMGASAAIEPESRRVSEHRHHLRNRPAVAVGDCMNVPLRSNSCDAAICIAVMHHLSTEERRIRCIQELVRIVKAGGLINVQAWAMEQQDSSKRKFMSTDVFVPFNAQPKYLDQTKQVGAYEEGDGGTTTSVAEMYARTYKGTDFDERKGLVVFKRYCHLYRAGEIEALVHKVKGVELVESGYESGNHFVILRALER